MSVRVKFWPSQGKWIVLRTVDGKRKSTLFDSKESADAEAGRLRAEIADAHKEWTFLTARERYDLTQAYHEARQRGLNLLQLIHTADEPAKPSGVKLEQVVNEALAAKKSAGRATKYVACLRSCWKQFSKGREAAPFASITAKDIEAHLAAATHESRSSIRSRISTLMRYGVRRGYRANNPCDQLETVYVARKTPRIFTQDELRKCVEFLKIGRRRKLLGWFALTCFCGLRPEEAEQVRKNQVHFAEGWVRVEFSKVRQRRVVYPKTEAMEFLKVVLPGSKLPISTQSRIYALKQLRAHLGWTRWPTDVTRHTAASHWLADSRSAADVAESMGTSEGTLKRHYKALVTKAEAGEFWKLVRQYAESIKEPCKPPPP